MRDTDIPIEFRQYLSETPKCKFITTTQTFVDWALSRNTRNRKPNDQHIRQLMQEMTKDWYATPDHISFSTASTGCVLLNGQHRLMANKSLGYPPIQVGVDWGMEEKSQAKTDRGMIRMFKAVLTILTGETITHQAAIATRFIAGTEAGNVCNRPSDATAEETYYKYRDAFESLHIQAKHRGMGAGFIAAMVKAVNEGADACRVQEFIDKVTTGENIGKNHPAMTYRNLYMREGRAVNQKHTFHYAQKALDAFLKGKTICKLYLPKDTYERTSAKN